MKTCDFPKVSQDYTANGAFLRLKRWAIVGHPYGMNYEILVALPGGRSPVRPIKS